MKYWLGTLREYNWDKEYNYDYLIPAKTETQAFRKLKEFARGWYSEDKPKWDGEDRTWDFSSVLVQVRGVDRTTKKEFIERMLRLYTLEGGEL